MCCKDARRFTAFVFVCCSGDCLRVKMCIKTRNMCIKICASMLECGLARLHVDRETDRRMDIQTDRWTGIKIDRQIIRQI